jgi:hypothetical protein
MINRLYEKYGARGFQPTYVSLIEGEVRGKPVTIDEEVAFDRSYWTGEYHTKFPIAIYNTKTPEKDKIRERPAIFETYGASYPTYCFIDKKGTLRYIQVGHSGNIEQRFAEIIEGLLAE